MCHVSWGGALLTEKPPEITKGEVGYEHLYLKPGQTGPGEKLRTLVQLVCETTNTRVKNNAKQTLLRGCNST